MSDKDYHPQPYLRRGMRVSDAGRIWRSIRSTSPMRT